MANENTARSRYTCPINNNISIALGAYIILSLSHPAASLLSLYLNIIILSIYTYLYSKYGPQCLFILPDRARYCKRLPPRPTDDGVDNVIYFYCVAVCLYIYIYTRVHLAYTSKRVNRDCAHKLSKYTESVQIR